MKRCGLVFIILMFSGGSALANRGDSRKVIRLSSYVDVAKGPVTLKDLTFSTDEGFEPSLYKLKLADAPKAGEIIKFTNSALSQAIQHFIASIKNSEIKKDLQSIQIIIPKEVTVQGAGWQSSNERLYHLIPSRLGSFCNWECEIIVDEVHPPAKKNHYNNETQFDIGSLKSIPRGSFSVEALVTQNNVTIDKSWIRGRLRVMKHVPVAKRLLQQGERLNESDFEIKNRDITMETDTTPDVKKLVGLKLKRTISPNQIISNSVIERERDVVYGQPVRVIMRNENWQISLEGVSRDNGSIGDRVKVFNPLSKKMLSGTLVSRGVVEIQ